MESKIIHFFNYLEYENLDELGMEFEFPIKSGPNPHMYAKLRNPIYFYLPKSNVSEIETNEYGENILNYEIDLDEHIDILQFFDNLDTLCINKTIINSNKWFKKKIDQNKLINSYTNIYYNDELNERIAAKFYISDKNCVKIKDYNKNSSLNLLSKIDSLEFIRNKFKLKLEIVEIVEGLDTIDNLDDDLNDEDIDFSKMLSIENNSNDCEESNNNLVEKKGINTEIINELANDFEYSSSHNKLLRKEKEEIQEEINKKKNLKKNLLISSEKARKGIETNKEKINDLDSELETLQIRMDSF